MAARPSSGTTQATAGDIFLLGTMPVVFFEWVGSNKARVLTVSHTLKTIRRTALEGPFPLSLDTSVDRNQLVNRLDALEMSIAKAREELDPAELWEILIDAPSEQSVFDIATLWFGDTATPEQTTALATVLLDAPAYFSRRNLSFTPKSQDKVAATLRNIEVQERTTREREEVRQWFVAARDGHRGEETPVVSRHIELLANYVIHCGGDSGTKNINPLLDALNLEGEEEIFETLVELGHFHEDENLLLLRHDVPRNFSQEVLAAAVATQNRAEDALACDNGREEIEEAAWTIDDEDTQERDDAISLIELPEGGYRLGVHITDVSALIHPKDVLDKEAQQRAATLYLPEGSITMLPPAVSHGPLSLDPGTKRRCVSAIFHIAKDYSVQSARVAKTWVRLERAYTYDEVLELIATDGAAPKLEGLVSIAEARATVRSEQGARPPRANMELKIRVDQEKRITVKLLPRLCPARTMVAELMILANCNFAKLLKERNVPCIFRTQPVPKTDAAEGEAVFFPPVRVSTEALEHAALGVECYTQASSPIRRYGDLLVQRQLVAAIDAAEPAPYSAEEILYLVETTELAQSTIASIERWSVHYWLCKYLTTYHECSLPAIVLFRRRDHFLVELTDYSLRVPLYPAPTSVLSPGDHIEVRLVDVRPRRGSVRIEQVRD